MSYIYKITNNINGKVYIGKTNKTIMKKFKKHCEDSLKYKERPLYRAFNKYGIKSFSVNEIEECNPNIVNEREKYWIEYYNSFKNGYNATLGGDGKSYLDYDLIYKTYKEIKSITETAKIIGCSKDSVKIVLENYHVSQKEILNNVKIKSGKAVAMIDKVTGKILKTFINTHEAGRYLGKTHQHIQEVCQGKRKSAYGYFWKYLEK